MADLLPCPFCGAGARLYRVSSHALGSLTWIQCETCSARAQEFTGEFGDEPEQNALRAVAAWSTRPEEDRLRSALQASERERDASYEAHAATMKTLDAERAWREQERNQLVSAVDHALNDRDAARLEAGRLAQELVEVTGKLVVASRWTPYHSSTLPKEQGEYLCLTGGGTRVVLEWDAIAWDHPIRSQSDWRHWNEAVTHWRDLPAAPEALEPKEVAGG